MVNQQLVSFLNKKVKEYNQPSFITNDPVCIPHLFTKKQDIEIAGFFAAIFAWGIRTTIINKSKELLARMDNAPYDFCINHCDADLKKLIGFKHRTFNDTDLLYFVSFFKFHYSQYESLEDAFLLGKKNKIDGIEAMLNGFYQHFFSLEDVPHRTMKHIASPAKNSTCKRLCMYLRWMVRKDNCGVDLGIWDRIKMKDLMIPLDLHVGRVARSFGLIHRPSTDWQTVVELTEQMKQLDPKDPSKYDYALFALGILEKF